MSIKVKSTFVKAPAVLAIAAASALVTAGPAAADWTGVYVGLQAGWGWGDSSQPFGLIGGPLVFSQADADLNGPLVGGHLGFNWGMGGFMFGVEGDLEYSGIIGDDGGSAGDINELEARMMASIRLRAGVDLDPTMMVYATGGWAYMDAYSNTTPPIETRSVDFGGWTFGVGLETVLGNHATGRIEYRFTDFDQERVSLPVNGYDLGVEPEIHAVRIGFSWLM